MLYIPIIQMCLIVQLFLVFFCELTPTFAHTFKSVVLRAILAISLISLGYYAQYLTLVHTNITLAVFFVVLIITFLSIHFIGKEYLHRLRKIEKLERLKRQRSIRKGYQND